MTLSDVNTFYCADQSRAAAEPLYGTATQVKTWLLLEYRQPWGAKAFEESDLPEAVKAALRGALADLPAARLQLIRQPVRPTLDVTFFLAVADDTRPRLYRFSLENHAALLDLDLGAVVDGVAAYAAQRIDGPLFLVCGNGKRDRCCARYGVQVYDALAQAAPDARDAIWQTTHLGGHRFAATGVLLPHGLVYGRLDPDNAPPALDAYRAGELRLELLRGRSAYPAPAQAAEYFLRQETGDLRLDDLRLLDVVQAGEAQWTARFANETQVHTMTVALGPQTLPIYESCGAAQPVLKPLPRLVALESMGKTALDQ